MKLLPNYSYEFNIILNEGFSENDQIKNFASLLTDKDRFLSLLPILERNLQIVEKYLGYKLRKEIDFYVVRAEKFKSFSMPVTIEYSLFPEEMILYLLKEIIKISILDRFPDDNLRETYINSFIGFIIKEGNWGNLDFGDVFINMNEYSKSHFSGFKILDLDFKKMTMKEYLEKLFEEEFYK